MADIYSTERKLDSIIEFLESRLESNTTIYEPTRHRFEALIEKFNTAIKLTTRIIQEDELQDEEEFENNPSVNMEQVLDTLYQLADKYEELLGQPTSAPKKPRIPQLSIGEKKEVISQYRDCIDYLVEKTDKSGIGYARECAFTIKQWFDARYKVGETDFKYDVKTLPMWILGIVVTYAHHVLTNTTLEFVIEFADWVDNVDENPMYSTYPVPYNIYMNTKDVCVDDASLTSMVLWDLLFDNGFYRLIASKVPMNQDDMQQLYKNSKNIAPMSNVGSYKYYKDDESILYVAELLIETEGEEDE